MHHTRDRPQSVLSTGATKRCTMPFITPLTGPSQYRAQALQSIAGNHEHTPMSTQCHDLVWCVRLKLSTSACGGQGGVTSAYAAILLLFYQKP